MTQLTTAANTVTVTTMTTTTAREAGNYIVDTNRVSGENQTTRKVEHAGSRVK